MTSSRIMNLLAAVAVAAFCLPKWALSFQPIQHVAPRTQPQFQRQSPFALYSTTSPNNRKPSRVTDEDGPTPEIPFQEPAEVGPEDLLELQEIENYADMPEGPIPHQPWRRGETAGCEAPITAEWRVQAEQIMKKAVTLVGAEIVDITWFLTSVLVTIDESSLENAQDMLKSKGPEIVYRRATDPIFYDPEDPKPEPIWDDEDETVYQRETEEEAEDRRDKFRNTFAKPDPELDPEDESHIPAGEEQDVDLYMNEESRQDAAYTTAKEVEEQYDELDKPMDLEASMAVDKAALSTVAQAMIDALTDVEEELGILGRHELVLSSPGPPDLLETQQQFNARRGADVIVETQDPWQSNRVLKGKLLDRNAMDVMINKQGRMVTIPLNFVRCVRLPPPKDGDFADGYADDDVLQEYEEYEDEALDEAEQP